MRVNEIFRSVQGEGTYTGRSATFIRLAGCNRKCSFCDTEHAAFVEMSCADVLKHPDVALGNSMAVITGGEPLIAGEAMLETLVAGLAATHEVVALETNGDLLPRRWPSVRKAPYLWVTCSPKDEQTMQTICSCGGSMPNEWKFVVGADAWKPAALHSGIKLLSTCYKPAIWLSPVYVDGQFSPEAIRQTVQIVSEHRCANVRVCLQTHKCLNVK